MHNVAGVTQGWGDSELSDRGRQQVARVAERLKAFTADALFSSSLNRALTTAQKIAEATGLDVRVLDELREMNYGRWEGKKFLDVRKTDEENYQRWITDDEFACPGGESHSQVRTRIAHALESVKGFRRPILVAHGTAIRIAATVLLGLPLSVARSFAQDNAAINVFSRRADHWILKSWNDTNEG